MLNGVALRYRAYQERVAARSVTAGAALDRCAAALAQLSFKEAELSEISLWDRLPFRLACTDGRWTIVDLTAIPHLLSRADR